MNERSRSDQPGEGRNPHKRPPRSPIAVVGPCGSGKSTLVHALRARGYPARQIAQEHSYVPEMWRILTRPALLIYLDASYQTCTKRKNFVWQPEDYAEQIRRLSHAREHCDVYLQTDERSPEDVLAEILEHLELGLSSHSTV